MGQEEGPLAPTEIESSSEYESENETSTRSALSLYTSSLPILPPPSSLLLLLSPSLQYNMSQCSSINYKQGGGATERSNAGPNIKVARPPIFSGETRNVAGFLTIYKLFLKMKIRGVAVEEQI